jgi:hypothetical protein
MFEKIPASFLPLTEILSEIDGFKSRMSNILDIDLDLKLLYESFDNLYEVVKDRDLEGALLLIKDIQKYINEVLFEVVNYYLEKRKFDPIEYLIQYL